MFQPQDARSSEPASKSIHRNTGPTSLFPPRAPLAFRVGVVGHRPNRLKQAEPGQLGAVVSSILRTVKEEVLAVGRNLPTVYDSSVPVLRAISPLAEGTDRIFAAAALRFEYELCCVMPFPQAEFEKDFASERALEPDSLHRFRELLARAKTRFELDGSRADEGTAYGAGGRVVLNQSDLLIVVWDGQRSGKRGGTEETLDEARKSGVPVVWVDAYAPHTWQMLTAVTPLPEPTAQRVAPCASEPAEALRKWVHEALDLPKSGETKLPGKADDQKRNLELFYAERQPKWTIAVMWKAFRDIFGDGKWPTIKLSVRPFEEDVEEDWPRDRGSPIGHLVDSLRTFYAWPDKLAVLYADLYRSAFILAFLLAALAVGMALLPIGANLEPHGWAETTCTAVELAAILVILGLVFQGRRGRWHERWIDYRLTAELVRHLRLVAPLGGARPFPQVPAHWATYGQPGATWMAWYVRSVERAVGLPSAVLNRSHLEECLVHLEGLVKGQIRYHETTANRCHQIEQRLHFWGIGFLALTLVSCSLHLAPGMWQGFHLPVWLPSHLLVFFCGFFPAFGAALAGINNQGEFRRITKRSGAMCNQLEPLLRRIEHLRERVSATQGSAGQQHSVPAAALAGDATRLLINEVLDWRVVFLDRPLHPPV